MDVQRLACDALYDPVSCRKTFPDLNQQKKNREDINVGKENKYRWLAKKSMSDFKTETDGTAEAVS